MCSEKETERKLWHIPKSKFSLFQLSGLDVFGCILHPTIFFNCTNSLLMVDVMLLCTTEANFKMIESVMIYFHSHLYSRVNWVCTSNEYSAHLLQTRAISAWKMWCHPNLKNLFGLSFILPLQASSLIRILSSSGCYKAFIGRCLPQTDRVAGCPSTCPVCLPSLLLASISFQLEQLCGAGFKLRACKVSTPCFTALTDTLIWHAMNS